MSQRAWELQKQYYGTEPRRVRMIEEKPSGKEAWWRSSDEVDELAGVLRAGHRSIILEADDWRPLAQHVQGLIDLAEQRGAAAAATEIGALKSTLDGIERLLRAGFSLHHSDIVGCTIMEAVAAAINDTDVATALRALDGAGEEKA